MLEAIRCANVAAHITTNGVATLTDAIIVLGATTRPAQNATLVSMRRCNARVVFADGLVWMSKPWAVSHASAVCVQKAVKVVHVPDKPLCAFT